MTKVKTVASVVQFFLKNMAYTICSCGKGKHWMPRWSCLELRPIEAASITGKCYCSMI